MRDKKSVNAGEVLYRLTEYESFVNDLLRRPLEVF